MRDFDICRLIRQVLHRDGHFSQKFANKTKLWDKKQPTPQVLTIFIVQYALKTWKSPTIPHDRTKSLSNSQKNDRLNNQLLFVCRFAKDTTNNIQYIRQVGDENTLPADYAWSNATHQREDSCPFPFLSHNDISSSSNLRKIRSKLFRWPFFPSIYSTLFTLLFQRACII